MRLETLKRENLPNHVAIIMDGNGRWAKQHGRPRVFGHRRGADTVRMVVETSGQLGIKVLSLFAFSEENWARPSHEVTAIMTLLNTYLVKEREELLRNNVQLRTMGRIERLPKKTQQILHETQQMLRSNTGLVLNIALSYGGRTDVLEACRAIARRVHAGSLLPQDITAEIFAEGLSGSDLPEPDLLIRTSGEQRISNFMLWQLAYTELYFTARHWPEFSQDDYLRALADYLRRQRRFGCVVDDTESSEGAVLAGGVGGDGTILDRGE